MTAPYAASRPQRFAGRVALVTGAVREAGETMASSFLGKVTYWTISIDYRGSKRRFGRGRALPPQKGTQVTGNLRDGDGSRGHYRLA